MPNPYDYGLTELLRAACRCGAVQWVALARQHIERRAAALGRCRDGRRRVAVDGRGDRRHPCSRRRPSYRGLHVLRIDTNRQHDRRAPRGSHRGMHIAVEVIDLNVFDAVEDEHVDVPVRVRADVGRIRPRLSKP